MSPGSPWISFHRPQAAPRIRLFCLPYAGGGAALFRKWQDMVPEEIEICPIELPGRGRRHGAAPFRLASEAVAAVCDGIAPYVQSVAVAILGHSMGAILAYELALSLRRSLGIDVAHLFVSATRAPRHHKLGAPTHNLPEPEFVEHLRRLRGTPTAVLANPEAVELLLPCVRADFELVQTYRCSDDNLLRCPVRAFGGFEDPEISRDDLLHWREVTSGAFSLSMLRGDHFFLTGAEADLLSVVTRDLANLPALRFPRIYV